MDPNALKSRSALLPGGVQLLSFLMNPVNLEKIANSKSAEFQFGSFRGELGAEEKQMLSDMLSLSK